MAMDDSLRRFLAFQAGLRETAAILRVEALDGRIVPERIKFDRNGTLAGKLWHSRVLIL